MEIPFCYSHSNTGRTLEGKIFAQIIDGSSESRELSVIEESVRKNLQIFVSIHWTRICYCLVHQKNHALCAMLSEFLADELVSAGLSYEGIDVPKL